MFYQLQIFEDAEEKLNKNLYIFHQIPGGSSIVLSRNKDFALNFKQWIIPSGEIPVYYSLNAKDINLKKLFKTKKTQIHCIYFKFLTLIYFFRLSHLSLSSFCENKKF